MTMGRNTKGFTLIEVLIALTVFAVGLISLAGMQILAIRTNSSSNTLTASTALAEGVLEEILAWDLADPRLAADSDGSVDWDFEPGPEVVLTKQIGGAGIYTATYAVDVDYGAPNVTRIEVIVQGGGSPQRATTVVGFKRAI